MPVPQHENVELSILDMKSISVKCCVHVNWIRFYLI